MSYTIYNLLPIYFHITFLYIYAHLCLDIRQLRGCPLRGILSTLDDHERRFTDHGWDHAEAIDMDKVTR